MLYQGIIGGGSSPVEPVDLSPVLLWTNPTTSGDFTGQKISVDLTDYVGAIIEYTSRGTTSITSREFVKKSDALDTFFGSGYYDGGNGHGRNITAIDNSGITFGGSYYGSSNNDGFVKPYKIYGVKEYVVEPVSNINKFVQASGNSGASLTLDAGKYYVTASIAMTEGVVQDFNISGATLNNKMLKVDTRLGTICGDIELSEATSISVSPTLGSIVNSSYHIISAVKIS